MQQSEGYEKGELVPERGTYRCTGCGELWTADQTGVRFPPCDDDKQGHARWIPVDISSPPQPPAGQ